MTGTIFPRASWALFALALAGITAAVVAVHDDYAACVECYMLEPLRRPVPWEENFLSCSNMDQSISWDASSNVRESTGEVAGWTAITAKDPAKEASVVVRIRKAAGLRRVVFYPRCGGGGSDVTVQEDNAMPRRLFQLAGPDQGWTPLGGQYPFNFLCVEHGYQTWKSFETRLIIKLRGPWAQLWHKDGKVFF